MSAVAGQDQFPELPIDSDVGQETGEPHAGLRARDLGLVFAGGVIGTALRALLGVALPSVAGIATGTLVVNLAGSFALGVLLEWLGRSGPDTGWRRRMRLLGGTGLLGGFTTYSALALETIDVNTPFVLGVLYALGFVVVGPLFALAGILTARAAQWQSRRPEAGPR